MKRFVCAAALLACFFFSVFPSDFGAGIFYPKRRFCIYQYRNPPSSSPYKRFEKGDEYQQEILFLISFAGNSFKYDFDMHLFTKKVYKKLFIKELSYEYEGKTGFFIKGKKYVLPEKICTVEETEEQRGFVPCWITNGTYYWTQDIYFSPGDGRKRMPRVNFERIFKGKKPGSTFSFNMSVVYQFDGEEEKTLAFEYRVECWEGEWVSPFMGW